VSRADDAPTFFVHRLVQDATRRSLESDADCVALTAAFKWIDEAYVGDPEDVRSWPTLEPLAPHTQACTHIAEAAGIVYPTARLYNQLGQFYRAQARYEEAEPLYRRAMEMVVKFMLETGHPHRTSIPLSKTTVLRYSRWVACKGGYIHSARNGT
jgi:tetratricopeptide (TPR) repeat protein